MWNLETPETLACPRPAVTLDDISEPQTRLCRYAICHCMKPLGTTRVAVQCSRSPTSKHNMRGAPPTQVCPGGRQVSSAPAMGRWGTKGQQQRRQRWDGPHRGMILLYVRFRQPPRYLVWCWRVPVSPLHCCSAHAARLCAQSNTGDRRERIWDRLTNFVKHWRGAFVGQNGTRMLSCVTSAWRSQQEYARICSQFQRE